MPVFFKVDMRASGVMSENLADMALLALSCGPKMISTGLQQRPSTPLSGAQ